MKRINPDTFVCTLCNTTVAVNGEDQPVIVLAAQSGQPNMRLVSVDGVEVHRCTIPATPGTIRMT
jgi:hypothetical protein